MGDMQFAKEVKAFSAACEQILSTIVMSRLVTLDDTAMITYYCRELLAKIAPILVKQESR